MESYRLLFLWFGIGFSLLMVGMIAYPVLRKGKDAITAWNLLLMSALMFTGVGGIELYSGELHWRELRWFSPESYEITWYFIGTFVFYVALFLFHYFTPFTSKLLQNRLRKWPETSGALALFVVVVCAITAVAPPFLRGIPFISEVSLNFSHAALSTAVVFTAVYWLKNRLNPFALFLFLVVFAGMAVQSMVIFHGRRLLLAVVLAPILATYWVRMRYWKGRRQLAVLALGLAGVLLISAAFATFRHFRGASGERSASTIVSRITSINTERMMRYFDDMPFYVAQYNTRYSLLMIRLIKEKQLEVVPAEALLHVLSYPIPRQVWQDKPRDLGTYIVPIALKRHYKTTWGVGIVGQGFHDGGLILLVLYAFLISIIIKVFDEPMQRQPSNPFLIAGLAAAAPHMAAWIRGGTSTMTLNCLESLLFVILLGFVTRMFFGTAGEAAHGPPEVKPPSSY